MKGRRRGKGGKRVTDETVEFQQEHSPREEREEALKKFHDMSAQELVRGPLPAALDLPEAFMFNPDMKEINSSMGQQGPSSTYPIPWDDAPISDLKRPKDGSKCVPHAPVLPAKYSKMMRAYKEKGGTLGGELQTTEEVGFLTYKWRTPEMRKAQHEKFNMPGNNIAASDHTIMNQVNEPLLNVPHVLMISPLVLHMTLGLVTDEITKMLTTIRDLEQPTPERIKILQEADDYLQLVAVANQEVQQHQHNIHEVEERLAWLQQAYPQALIKEGRRYLLQSEEARAVQHNWAMCTKFVADAGRQMRKAEKEVKALVEKEKEVRADADKVRGELEQEFNKLLYNAGVRGP